jgi:hypothetical protein
MIDSRTAIVAGRANGDISREGGLFSNQLAPSSRPNSMRESPSPSSFNASVKGISPSMSGFAARRALTIAAP